MFRIVHFEIPADDPQRAIKFYTGVFGWKIEKWEGGDMDYWMVMTGEMNAPGGINGGLFKRMDPIAEGSVNAFQCTVEVPDASEYEKKVKDAGGTVVMQKMEIQKVGWYSLCKDTEGNYFSILQAIPMDRG